MKWVLNKILQYVSTSFIELFVTTTKTVNFIVFKPQNIGASIHADDPNYIQLINYVDVYNM